MENKFGDQAQPPSAKHTNNNDNIISVSFPLELELNILSRLPIKPLLRFQCVCKRWRHEINHPNFIKSHTMISQTHKGNSGLIVIFKCWTQTILLSSDFHSSAGSIKVSRLHDFPTTYDHMLENLVGCCNGLLLFMKIKRNSNNITEKRSIFSIYNPSTSNILTLSQIPPEQNKHCDLRAGFGFDGTNDDYKILCLYGTTYSKDDFNRVSYVYSLKSNSWKIIQGPPNNYSHCSSTKIVFFNNALHLIASKLGSEQESYILCFDLGIEEYHEVTLPEQDSYGIDWQLVALRGCLHLVKYDRFSQQMMIWFMKGYGSTPSLWDKLIDNYIPLKQTILSASPYYYATPMPCAYSEDGHELLISPGHLVRTFTRCDLRSGDLKTVEIAGLPVDLKCLSQCQIMPWNGSLVKL